MSMYIYMYICICVYMTPNNRKHLYRAPTRGRPHVGSASPHIPVLKVTRYAITCVSSKVVGVVESRAPDERYICIYTHIYTRVSTEKIPTCYYHDRHSIHPPLTRGVWMCNPQVQRFGLRSPQGARSLGSAASQLIKLASVEGYPYIGILLYGAPLFNDAPKSPQDNLPQGQYVC